MVVNCIFILVPADDWVKRMEEDMQRMREEHEKRFADMRDPNDFPQPPRPEDENGFPHPPPFERPPFRRYPDDMPEFDFPRPPHFPEGWPHDRNPQQEGKKETPEEEQPKSGEQ